MAQISIILFFVLLQLLTIQSALSLECGEFYSVHHHHLHHASESADNEQHHEGSILETRIVNGELASLGEFPWQISMQRRVRPKVAAAAGSGSANKTASPPAAALPGIASTKPETPSSSPPPPPALPSQPPVPQDPVEKVQNTSSASSSSNEANLITEDEILDESLWGRFLWPVLAAQKNITFLQNNIVNWPPPVPTHAPGSQTFPPLPTHPPGQRLPPIPTHAPGSQTYPPMPPMPTFPPGVGSGGGGGGAQRPGWAPGPGQQWPPPAAYPPRLPPRPQPLPPPSSTFPPLITSTSSSFPPFPSSTTFRPPRPTQPPQPPKPIPSLPPPSPSPPPPRPRPPRPPMDPSQKWQHFCGGSIIDPSWILTAAHCVEALKHTYTPGLIRVVAGSLDWRNLDQSQRSSAQVISVTRIVVHPGWSQASGQNDVALLHLQTPLEFTRDADNAKVVTVNKVCLSRSAEGEHSGMATSSGWGFLHKDQRVSPDLMRRVDIPVVDHATCRSAFSRVIGVTQMQVCAGQAPKGNCMGDSGGPLVQKSSKGGSGRATQIGIVSFSIPCAVPGYPDVFTRVAKYLDWISQNSGIPF